MSIKLWIISPPSPPRPKTKKNGLYQRYRVFFSPEKFVPHSLDRFGRILWFFFPPKKYKLYFFFQEKFESHSLEKNNIICKKSSKNGKLDNFRRFSSFGGVFFFPTIFCIFFSQEKFTFHSLTHSQGAGKKIQQWKKKYTIFTHSLDFCPKMEKVKLFPKKKKRYLWLYEKYYESSEKFYLRNSWYRVFSWSTNCNAL